MNAHPMAKLWGIVWFVLSAVLGFIVSCTNPHVSVPISLLFNILAGLGGARIIVIGLGPVPPMARHLPRILLRVAAASMAGALQGAGVGFLLGLNGLEDSSAVLSAVRGCILGAVLIGPVGIFLWVPKTTE